MKILGKQPSREKCAESAWFAKVRRIFGFRSKKRISYCLLRVPVHGMNNNIIFKADCMQNPSLLYCAHEIITGGRV